MKIGTMRHRATLRKPVTSTSSYGGQTVSYNTLASDVACIYEETGGGEYWRGMKLDADVTGVLTMRYMRELSDEFDRTMQIVLTEPSILRVRGDASNQTSAWRFTTRPTVAYTTNGLVYWEYYKYGDDPTIAGDAGSQITSIRVDGVTDANSDSGVLYWSLLEGPSTVIVALYSDSGFGSGDKVATTGTFAAPGTANLSESNSSGVSGSITLASGNDDRNDASNTLTFRPQVRVYRNTTKALTDLVCQGSRTGDGEVTLTDTQDQSGGAAGTVTVAYSADDTDTGNTIQLFRLLKVKRVRQDPKQRWIMAQCEEDV